MFGLFFELKVSIVLGGLVVVGRIGDVIVGLILFFFFLGVNFEGFVVMFVLVKKIVFYLSCLLVVI